VFFSLSQNVFKLSELGRLDELHGGKGWTDEGADIQLENRMNIEYYRKLSV